MEFLFLFLLLVSLIVQSVIVWLYFTLSFSLKSLHKRVDAIFSVDIPSPNEATQKKDDGVELSEQNMLNIPSDVKFEIEGGDEQVPPGYTAVKAK